MKAVIMAGGEGTRLRPLTCARPKPMVKVFNKPVMEHIINLLKKHGITQIAVTLQYLPHSIQEYFGDGSDFGVELQYFTEDKPLGTAGSVKNAEDYLSDTFLVVSGDALTDINLSEALKYHLNKGSVATIVLTKVEVPLEYGVVITDSTGRINRFIEKPNWSEVFSDTVNTGIYILDKKVLNNFGKNTKFDFSKDLFPILLKENQPMYGYISDNYWCDIGDIFAYQQCNYDILDKKVNIENNYKILDDNIWIGNNILVGNNVSIEGPVLIGDGVKIKDNAKIAPYTIIGNNSIIEKDVTLKKSIVWNNCIVSEKSQLRGCTLCDWVYLKQNCNVYENSVIGDRTRLNTNVIINPDIKIWPAKTIDEGTTVNTNLIWGSSFTKNIFGSQGISGEVNVEINSEFASRLGSAFGNLFKEQATIAVSTDGENASDMLKNSFISGLQSSGCSVYDFNTHILPITRAAIAFYKLNGGIHISTVSGEGDSKLYIDFINEKGINIDRQTERKLENLFAREDFRRCEAHEVKKVERFYEFKNYYIRSILNKKDTKEKYKSNVIISTPSGSIENIFKKVMESLGEKCTYSRMKLNKSSVGYSYMLDEEISYISREVVEKQYDIGILVDKKGEEIILIDDLGNYIGREKYEMLKTFILCESGIKNIVISNSASHSIEKIAEKYNIQVERTKISRSEVMKGMIKDNSNILNNFQYLLSYDSISSIVFILDFLNKKKLKLSQIMNQIPEIYMKKKAVECPWDKKGLVIRELIGGNQENNKNRINEGVKIFKQNGWVLVLPDGDKAVCNIIAEGYTEEYADELTNFYEKQINNIING